MASTLAPPAHDQKNPHPRRVPHDSRRRRPNRSRETSEATIKAAIPQGFARPQKAHHVLDVIEMHPQWARLYKNRKAGLKTVLEELVRVADYDTMTTRPTWAKIMERADLIRSTMSRHLATLRSWGLVATVAGGRRAEHAAAGPDGEKINEAAVYVLLVPVQYSHRRLPRKLPHRCAPQPTIHKAAVHENGTPTAVGGYLGLREGFTHARARGNHPPHDLTTGFSVPSCPGRVTKEARYPRYRPEIVWPGERRAANKREREAAAVELRRRLLTIFRGMSVPDVASALRDFLVGGWTVVDLIHAIEHRPDGSSWPYSGTPSTAEPRQVRGWLKFRLVAWRHPSGEPVPSPSARRRAETARRKAQQRRDWEQAQRARAQRSAPGSPAKAAALERMRARLQGRGSEVRPSC